MAGGSFPIASLSWLLGKLPVWFGCWGSGESHPLSFVQCFWCRGSALLSCNDSGVAGWCLGSGSGLVVRLKFGCSGAVAMVLGVGSGSSGLGSGSDAWDGWVPFGKLADIPCFHS